MFVASSPTWRHVLVTVAAAGAFSLVLLAAPQRRADGAVRRCAQAAVSGLGAAAEDKAMRPFQIHSPDEALVDLRRRLAATRWPDKRSEPQAGRFAS